MFNFMKKEKTEEERAEKERKKSEKRERKKSSKRDKLSQDELQRLEEVRQSLKIRGGSKRSKEDFSDEVDRSSVVGLRYSQFYLGGSESGVASPDSSDSASTWSSASLGRPRGILKARAEDCADPQSQSSSKLDLDDENLLLKNTAQNEMISYNKSPGRTADTELISAFHQNPQLDPAQADSQPGEYLGLKSRRLLSHFNINLPVIIQVAPTEAWRQRTLSRSASGSLVQV